MLKRICTTVGAIVIGASTIIMGLVTIDLWAAEVEKDSSVSHSEKE